MNKFLNFMHETYIRYRAKSPGYFKTLGDYLLVIAGICFAFQDDVLENVEKVIDLNLFPKPWLQATLKVFGLLATGGKLVSLVAVDNKRLTPEQRAALEQLARMNKQAASGQEKLLIGIVIASLTSTLILVCVLLFGDL